MNAPGVGEMESGGEKEIQDKKGGKTLVTNKEGTHQKEILPSVLISTIPSAAVRTTCFH